MRRRTSARFPSKRSCELFVLIGKRGVRGSSPLPRRPRKRKRRGVVDTSVLLAGVSGFKDVYVAGRVASADVLYRWANEDNFIWLVTEEILNEYKEILNRRHVRSPLIGRIIGLIR